MTAGRALVDDLRADGPAERELTDDELRRLLSCYGIHITDFRVASSESEAVAAANAIGYPVALKTFDEALRHREDQIGVRLDLPDAAAVASGYRDLAASTGRDRVRATPRSAREPFGVDGLLRHR